MIEPRHLPMGPRAPEPPAEQELQAATAATDPVCGMKVDPTKAPSLTLDGVTYGFCSEHCSRAFQANPAKYTRPVATEPVVVAPSAEWTCPMHPEVVRSKPGSCPICGMAL